MSKLFFRYGAMNSGKSTAMLQVAHNYEERDQRVVLVKSSVDTKGDDQIVSRLGVTRRADLLLSPGQDLRAALQTLSAQRSQLGDGVACVLDAIVALGIFIIAMADLRAIRQRSPAGTTLNDIILASLVGGLRNHVSQACILSLLVYLRHQDVLYFSAESKRLRIE